MSRVIREFIYEDDRGRALLKKQRLEPKRFRLLSRRDPSHGWSGCVLGSLEVFYRTTLYWLPEVREAVRAGEPIWWAEGERDADSLRGLGVVGTCTALSADGTLYDHASKLVGSSLVTVVADNDHAGAHSAMARLNLLGLAGVPAVVVAPPHGLKDVSEAVEAGLSLCDLRRPDLYRVAEAAAVYRAERRSGRRGAYAPEPPCGKCRNPGCIGFHPTTERSGVDA